MKLLIAEDDLTSRTILTAVVHEWGYEPIAVEDGAAAWQVMQGDDPPRLLLLDWEIPILNGLDLCKLLCEQQNRDPPYIILLTVRSSTDDIVAGLKGGANDYIPKPFENAELRARLEVGRRVLDMQAELNKSNSEIAVQSKKLSAVTDNIVDGIVTISERGIIESFNPAARKMFGYSNEEIIGKDVKMLMSEPHHNEFDAYLKQYMTMGEKKITGIGREVVGLHKDGTTFPMELPVSEVTLDNDRHFIGITRDVTERKNAEDKIQHLAFYDHLTDLPNRQLLLDRLKQALISNGRSGKQGALLFIDLDNFKNLNDTLGHDMGDMLLKQAAQRLAFCMREVDTVARLGGDEFVLMLLDLSGQALEAAAETKAISERILSALRQPYQLDKNSYRCTASLGAVIFNDPQQAIEELMKQADIAMYQAKKAGRNTLCFFDPLMQDNITARVSLEIGLQQALEHQQFQLHYQIQVDSQHRPLGAEALIRWHHPERGLVSPIQFIPLAEETGMILPIGLWVLEAACAQIKAWQVNARSRDLVISINVSAKQFHQSDFVNQIQAALQRHSINPKLLKLELTESLLQNDIEETIATMTTLNKIGVQFSLDDFGTGYSSLQYLKRLPLDEIKIDRSFVRDVDTHSSDKAIVSTIIAMAQMLSLDVIAEGVETRDQRQFLLDNGCTHFQGYLFGKSVPIEQLDILLNRG